MLIKGQEQLPRRSLAPALTRGWWAAPQTGSAHSKAEGAAGAPQVTIPPKDAGIDPHPPPNPPSLAIFSNNPLIDPIF